MGAKLLEIIVELPCFPGNVTPSIVIGLHSLLGAKLLGIILEFPCFPGNVTPSIMIGLHSFLGAKLLGIILELRLGICLCTAVSARKVIEG